MTTVRLSEGRRRLGEWVDRACRGEDIVITRRGQAVARLVPYQPSNPGDLPNRATRTFALVERIRQHRVGQSLGDSVSIKAMIDEGRR